MRTVKIRICQTAFIAALAAGLLAGCGEEKTIDYTIEGQEQKQEQQPESEGGNSELERFREEEVWEETWSEQILDDTIEIQVNAPITVPKAAKMWVVGVEETEFIEEYKENLAERLFDSGEIYYADYSHLPKKDLENIKAQLAEGYVESYTLNRTLEAIDADTEEMWAALDNIENAGDSYVPVENYTENKYFGIYEGRFYTLSFLDKDILDYDSYMRKIFWTVRDLEEVCPEKAKELDVLTYYTWKRGNWVENQCRMSEEDAEKEARRFVDKLGFADCYPVLSHTYPLAWGEEPDSFTIGAADSDKWLVDGYVFTFDLGTDDTSFVDYGTEEEYWDYVIEHHRKDEKRYSMGARLQVYITDQGVIGMQADSPVYITQVQEDVELLAADTVKGIFRDKLQGYLEKYWEVFRSDAYTGYMRFDAMDLIYFRVRDKEEPGKYSYVPTWRIAWVTKEESIGQINIRNQVLVNAIDGTLIDFFDET